jgi:hypothetical protein
MQGSAAIEAAKVNAIAYNQRAIDNARFNLAPTAGRRP